ncbi:30S ribosomal protein S9 [Candidatus Woesearchaeota archaeon]|jgi:small subunit ribosomal protein S9|nr:30S ribosomal protein S9 [Candidatus Woesearchaeota archaeon]MBT4595745.1 30S ribosomal protein S9 [Candidatus Woesearchaeota archaeon]MBT5741406.1 30S ribosomal protein S9 [Candidatus Woesearchaeota archaeon]MBT6505228.1 30S ribosomal protein S9 [Candidatus Woesearchaeota archaeon]MBT7848903.1 30S ribosomal protein S9 [Candidatus Woesearchaeota archaeon]
MKNIQSSGKRKSAIAHATLKKGTGKIRINKVLIDNYEKPLMYKNKIMEPILLAENLVKNYDISIRCNGGGISGQSDAIRLAIARAFVEVDKNLKKVYLDYDRQLIIADIRRNEKSHPNRSKPRAKRQKSYR